MARSYDESGEWRPSEKKPPEGAPNVIIFLLDNTDFAQIGSYGGLIKTVEFGGTGELYINGEKVDSTDMPKMHISTYSLAETFDVGRDTGTQVDAVYEGGVFAYSGELDRVVINLKD